MSRPFGEATTQNEQSPAILSNTGIENLKKSVLPRNSLSTTKAEKTPAEIEGEDLSPLKMTPESHGSLLRKRIAELEGTELLAPVQFPSSTQNKSSMSTPGSGDWLLSSDAPMPLGSLRSATVNNTMFGVALRGDDLSRQIPRLLQVPFQFHVYTINPDELMALARVQRRLLMKDLATTTQRTIVVLGDSVVSSNKLLRKKGTDLSNSAIMALSVALRGRPVVFAELLGVSPPSVIMELKPFCKGDIIKVENVPRFMHAVARSIAHRHSNPTVPADIGSLAGDIVAEIFCNSGSTISEESLKSLRLGFLDVLRVQGGTDAGMHIGLLRCGFEKYLNRRQAKVESRLRAAQLIIDATIGALTTLPIGFGIPPSVLSGIPRIIRAGGDRFIKFKLKRWDELRNNLDRMIENDILGQLRVYRTFIPVRNDKDEIQERIPIDEASFVAAFQSALRYNSITIPNLNKAS
jgi:hypothetical protein